MGAAGVVIGTVHARPSRSVVLASADGALRERLRIGLSGMRWRVREARGGAEAFAHMEEQPANALLLDHWLPDLEVGEFAEQMGRLYPEVDLLRLDGQAVKGGGQSPWRHELLHVLRESEHTPLVLEAPTRSAASKTLAVQPMLLEGMAGGGEAMQELARLVRLVAPRPATVLIEGETGTGKELVARALHRLSRRASRPMVVLNCAAIPEALLETELFGHARGAFTGATQARTGRVESAHGGTLFLDEIAEMPLALQAKLLRFLESGELQRVGENDLLHVDVRVLAATHRNLEAMTVEGTFRLDLYHRLAVFPLTVPSLRERREDIPALTEHFLALMGTGSPAKQLTVAALERLQEHDWPGNVRELAHVLERAVILAGDAGEISADHLRTRRVPRGSTEMRTA